MGWEEPGDSHQWVGRGMDIPCQVRVVWAGPGKPIYESWTFSTSNLPQMFMKSHGVKL
jgi:hypothetical protein